MSIQWIVNTAGELGVLVNGIPTFMYKGQPFVYESGCEYRAVEKREFGESGPTVEINIETHEWTSWVCDAPTEETVAVKLKAMSFPADGIRAVTLVREQLGLSLMEAVDIVRRQTGWCARTKKFV